MVTKNPRINVTFEQATAGLLAHLAIQEQKSLSSLVRELALEALEMREDAYLFKIASSLDHEKAKLYEHHEAWK
jgi:hypothetical protein